MIAAVNNSRNKIDKQNEKLLNSQSVWIFFVLNMSEYISLYLMS